MEKRRQILLPAVFFGSLVFAAVFFHVLPRYIEEQYASNEVYRQQKVIYMNAHNRQNGIRYSVAFPASKDQSVKIQNQSKEDKCQNADSEEKRICKDGSRISLYGPDCSAALCREKFEGDEIFYYSPYIKRGKEVLFEDGYSRALTPIAGADAATFRPVGVCASVEMSRAFYGKDKNRVYMNERLVQGADVRSFKYLGIFGNLDELPYSVSISTDKDTVYLGCGNAASRVDRESFEVLGNGYSWDRSGIYYIDREVQGADRDTFELIDYVATDRKIYGHFAVDKNYVFFEGYPLRKVDSAACKENGLGNCLPEHWHDLVDYSAAENSLVVRQNMVYN